MNQFDYTERTIAKDIDDVFSAIREEIKSNYFSSTYPDLTYIRDALCKHIPKIVANKNLLLLDTLLNYLPDDALRTLEKADSRIVNAFYEHNQGWRARLKSEFQQALSAQAVSLSPDLRSTYAGGAGFLVGGLAGLVVKTIGGGWIPLALAAVTSGAIASTMTYQKSLPLAMNKIEDDVAQYLLQSRTIAVQELQKTITNYKNCFHRFLQEQGTV